MLALKFLLLILGVCLFGSAAVIVSYDVYIATRLRLLLEQSRASCKAAMNTNFGQTARARAALPDRRPQPLWVARFASRKARP